MTEYKTSCGVAAAAPRTLWRKASCSRGSRALAGWSAGWLGALSGRHLSGSSGLRSSRGVWRRVCQSLYPPSLCCLCPCSVVSNTPLPGPPPGGNLYCPSLANGTGTWFSTTLTVQGTPGALSAAAAATITDNLQTVLGRIPDPLIPFPLDASVRCGLQSLVVGSRARVLGAHLLRCF